MRSEGTLKEKGQAYHDRWLRACYWLRWLLKWWGPGPADDDGPPKGTE